MPRLEEVFGISRKPLKSYVDRKDVDGRFLRALKGECHIVVYGSSKQGKSSLRQKHLAEEKCTLFCCGPATTTLTIYQHMLLDAKVRLEVTETTKTAHKAGGKVSSNFVAWLPFGVEVSGERAKESALQTQFIIPDLEEAQTVCTLLQQSGYDKWVVLENFHYLPEDVQNRLAYDLKTFQEKGILFIVLGIWKEANHLILHNGDLQDRVVEIPVEPWELADFEEVITKGEKALKLRISETDRKELKANAFGNIGMLQGFLRRYCELHGIEKTLETTSELKDQDDELAKLFAGKLEEYQERLSQSLRGIAAQSGRDGDKPLVLPYYLTQVVLGAPISDLLTGIARDDLLQRIRSIHYRQDKEAIGMADLIECLTALPVLQQNMQPPLLHYDVNQQRLKLVDTTQYFVLSRLRRDAAKKEIPHPLSPLPT